MSILSRYLLARYLFLFASILLFSILTISVIELLLNFEDIFERFEGLSGILDYMLIRIPSYYLRELFPVASFAAAFFCLGLAARTQEIVAAKTGGISPHRLAIPILLIAAFLSCVALLLNETVVLNASREWNRLENPGEEITFRRGSFWYHRGNVIYNVREADRDRNRLRGVSVYELTPEGRLLRSTRADVVEIKGGRRWRFRDATSRTFDPAEPTAGPKIEHVSRIDLEVAEARDLELLEARARNLSIVDLVEYVAVQEREGLDSARFRSMLHFRLSEPLLVLLFALLAIPLGVTVEQTKSLATSALYGIGIVGFFYAVRTGASMFTNAGIAPAAETPWGILLCFAGFGAVRFARVPR